ncbi:hypothetical protein FOZ63_026199 [Perkinsus olseni]|uniref:ATPase of the ABC class n=1 Tax=Perkinsus olseni TaxID=32597 RepID=A0A7J6TMA6_PEROL|nr:hypothetical protein FOZ63_026199 [Perkinsus olseni]
MGKGKGKGAYYKAKYGGGGNRHHGNGPYRDEASYGSEPMHKRSKTEASSSEDNSELATALIRLEGYSYGYYKDLVGEWPMPNGEWKIFIDRVQSDPYAPPSQIRLRVNMAAAKIPHDLWSTSLRSTACCDYITRHFHRTLNDDGLTKAQRGGGWSGSKGGDVQISNPGQQVLQRSCMFICPEYIEARCTLALPARGRTIEGYKAAEIIGNLWPLVRSSLYHDRLDQSALKKHVDSVDDQGWLRDKLDELGLVAFVRDGAILPRRSGVDDRPLMKTNGGSDVVAFKSPSSLSVAVDLPHEGRLEGMGIRKGVTLIVGGGFHGKSTLLEALQLGVYNHIPGDGREFVVTDLNAMKIRAEDGRYINNVDISPFISHLPLGRDTTQFSTEDASGSTSQAANIMEALEVGATTFLIDEDTSATNFMIRDGRMQQLVSADKEPITPFLWRVRTLCERAGVSTIMVIGGSGDYFHVADTVIMMDQYVPYDVTKRAKEIAAADDVHLTIPEVDENIFSGLRGRCVDPYSLQADGKVQSKSLRCISYGWTEIELTNVEQLVETGQARAIADAIQTLAEKDYTRGRRLSDVLDRFYEEVHRHAYPTGRGDEYKTGLDAVQRARYPAGYYSYPRKLELAAAIK